MYLVGLTGGVASGKSTVSSLLVNKHRFSCIDADEIARDVVQLGRPALKQIKNEFGETVLLPSGELDRSKLSDIIFKDAAAREKLNAITHPKIVREMMRRALKLYLTGCPVIILDTPLLFECNLDKVVNETVVVYSLPQSQLARLMSRDQITLKQAQKKIAAQVPLSLKRDMAGILIENSGDLERTEKQVDRMVPFIKRALTIKDYAILALTWIPAFLCFTLLSCLKFLNFY